MCNNFCTPHFHVCWSVVTRGCVFLAILSNSCQKNRGGLPLQIVKTMKIDNIDLTQQFSLSIFTDFRYQSIKITWLLPIFIDWLLRVFCHLYPEYCLFFSNTTTLKYQDFGESRPSSSRPSTPWWEWNFFWRVVSSSWLLTSVKVLNTCSD